MILLFVSDSVKVQKWISEVNEHDWNPKSTAHFLIPAINLQNPHITLNLEHIFQNGHPTRYWPGLTLLYVRDVRVRVDFSTRNSIIVDKAVVTNIL